MKTLCLLVLFFASIPTFALDQIPQESGSICIGPSLLPVLSAREFLQIDDGEKVPFSRGKVKAKIMATGLDVTKSHKAVVYDIDNNVLAVWKFKFEKGKPNLITIFRGAGDWHTVQNKNDKCEFPVRGCKFRRGCK